MANEQDKLWSTEDKSFEGQEINLMAAKDLFFKCPLKDTKKILGLSGGR